MQVPHETIYRSLFVQALGVVKKELMAHLRTRRAMRRARAGLAKDSPRGQITDAVSIRERPAQIEDRALPGHWEGDLVSGAKSGKDIYLMGGAGIIQSCLEAALLDEIRLIVYPVIAGTGKPLFRSSLRRHALRLESAASLDRGRSFLAYTVTR